MSDTREQAILVVDLVGYTADLQGSADRAEQRTMHLRNLAQQACVPHRGRVVEEHADTVILVHASVLGAVRCAYYLLAVLDGRAKAAVGWGIIETRATGLYSPDELETVQHMAECEDHGPDCCGAGEVRLTSKAQAMLR
jgi:hypothetical protein